MLHLLLPLAHLHDTGVELSHCLEESLLVFLQVNDLCLEAADLFIFLGGIRTVQEGPTLSAGQLPVQFFGLREPLGVTLTYFRQVLRELFHAFGELHVLALCPRKVLPCIVQQVPQLVLPLVRRGCRIGHPTYLTAVLVWGVSKSSVAPSYFAGDVQDRAICSICAMWLLLFLLQLQLRLATRLVGVLGPTA